MAGTPNPKRDSVAHAADTYVMNDNSLALQVVLMDPAQGVAGNNPRQSTLADQISVAQVAGSAFITNSWVLDGFGNAIASFAPAGNSSGMLKVCPVASKVLAFSAAGTITTASPANSADLAVD